MDSFPMIKENLMQYVLAESEQASSINNGRKRPRSARSKSKKNFRGYIEDFYQYNPNEKFKVYDNNVFLKKSVR
jgi:hypothetical protein